MIKNIVFDMGNVLVRFDPNAFLDSAGLTGADKTLLQREVYQSVEWAQLDRGSLTDEEVIEIFCRRVPERLHEKVRLLVGWWQNYLWPVAGMYELVQELKENGYGIYLLSNACLKHPIYWQHIPVSRFFDGVLVSAEVHLVKPQPEIYRLLCEKFSLLPEECFFMDDSTVNAEGAYFCGMQSAVFHNDADEIRRKLIDAGVNIGEKQL